MTNYTINWVPKEKIYPAFGIVNIDVSKEDNKVHIPKK